MDDVVISQDAITTGHREPAPPPTARTGSDAFQTLLMQLRDARGISKADLAKRSGLDPSTITRFEQGSRLPDRDTIMRLAEAMTLPVSDRDRLLAAAGLRSVVWDDPLLIELAETFADPALPADAREDLRTVIRVAIAHGRLARIGAHRTG